MSVIFAGCEELTIENLRKLPTVDAVLETDGAAEKVLRFWTRRTAASNDFTQELPPSVPNALSPRAVVVGEQCSALERFRGSGAMEVWWPRSDREVTSVPRTDRRIAVVEQLNFWLNHPSVSDLKNSAKFVFYLLVLPKTKVLYNVRKFRSPRQNGTFASDSKTVYLPLFFNVSLESQFSTLSIRPSVFLFKLSDFLAAVSQSREAQLIVRQTVDLLSKICWKAADQQAVRLLQDAGRTAPAAERTAPAAERSYNSSDPPVLLPASIDTQRALLDRICLAGGVESAVRVANCRAHSCRLKCPPTAVLNADTLMPPCVVKNRLGGGPHKAHRIGMILTRKGGEPPLLLRSASEAEQQQQHWLAVPDGFIVQPYIPHKRLLKVFVMGDIFWIVQHPPLANPHALRVCLEAASAAETSEAERVRPPELAKRAYPPESAYPPELAGPQELALAKYLVSRADSVSRDAVWFSSDVIKCDARATGKLHTRLTDEQFNYQSRGLISRQDAGAVFECSTALAEVFGTSLIGVDILDDGRDLFVVDVNYLPSYRHCVGTAEALRAALAALS